MMGRGGGGGGRFSRTFELRNEDKGRPSGWGVAPPSRHLWVGNLSPQVTLNLLSEQFLKFGDLENIAFIPGRSYAFVNYFKEEDAIIASRGLQGFVIHGMPLRIEFAKGDRLPGSSQYEDHPQFDEDRHSFKQGEPFIQRDVRLLHVSPDDKFSENKGNKNAEPSEMLWIGFPPLLSVNEMMLRKAFSPFGEIEKITTFPGRSYAFVRYRSIQAACRAKEALQGRLFDNPRVSICFAKGDVPSSEFGRSAIDSPQALHSRLNFNPGMGGRATEFFQGERSFENPIGDFHVAPPRFGSDVERMSADAGDMGFGRSSSIRSGPGLGPNFNGTLEHLRQQELGPQRRTSEDPYEHHRRSPAVERDAPWHDPPYEIPRRGPVLQDSWGASDSSFPLLKKLKTDSFPDRELPEYPFTDLGQEKQDGGPPKLLPSWQDHDNYKKSVDSGPFGYKGIPHHPRTLPHPPSENDDSWRTFDGFNSGSALQPPQLQSSVNHSEPHQPRLNKEWKWEGTIAKGGTPVCRARCLPVGKVLDFMLPEFLDCTARTGLEMLAKHYYQAAGSWVVFFVPETDADIVLYNEFMHYLGEKQRAAVAKLGEKTTLFLVPPSDFSQQVLKVPGKVSISGVILKFQQASTNFSSLHHPLDAMESKLPSAMQRPPERVNSREDTSLRKLSSPNYNSSSQGQSYFNPSTGHFPSVNPTLASASKQSGGFHHSEPVHLRGRVPDFQGENKHDHLQHQSPVLQSSWSSDITKSSFGTLPPPRNAPPHSFDNNLVEDYQFRHSRVAPGPTASTYTPETSNIPPLPQSKFLPQQGTKPHQSSLMPLPLEPEQLAQLAAILGQQNQSGKEPVFSTNAGGKQASLAQTSNLIGHASGSSGSVVSQFTHASAPSGSGGPQHSYGSAASSSGVPHVQPQHEQQHASNIPVVQENPSQQAPNSTADETEADPQQRLQATLQLAAALLQQIQQQGKT